MRREPQIRPRAGRCVPASATSDRARATSPRIALSSATHAAQRTSPRGTGAARVIVRARSALSVAGDEVAAHGGDAGALDDDWMPRPPAGRVRRTAMRGVALGGLEITPQRAQPDEFAHAARRPARGGASPATAKPVRGLVLGELEVSGHRCPHRTAERRGSAPGRRRVVALEADEDRAHGIESRPNRRHGRRGTDAAPRSPHDDRECRRCPRPAGSRPASHDPPGGTTRYSSSSSRCAGVATSAKRSARRSSASTSSSGPEKYRATAIGEQRLERAHPVGRRAAVDRRLGERGSDLQVGDGAVGIGCREPALGRCPSAPRSRSRGAAGRRRDARARPSRGDRRRGGRRAPRRTRRAGPQRGLPRRARRRRSCRRAPPERTRTPSISTSPASTSVREHVVEAPRSAAPPRSRRSAGKGRRSR